LSGIFGILLAAGSSSRFGSNKLLSRLPDGRTVAAAAARSFIQVLPETLAVVRPGDEALAQLLQGLGLRVVVNPDAETGLGSSLATGVRATAQAGGWVVGLADMPWISAVTIASVADRLRDGASAAAPVYQGQRGHPVGFGSRWRESLGALTGDQGGRDLLASEPGGLVQIETSDAGVVRDVDVPDDLTRHELMHD
jgi:molybdenum cofactor cytidylyltransferase